MKLFATTKYLFTVLLYCFALDSSPAFAAKKEDSKYTGPALVFNQPFGWYMNELEKCFAFNRRKFENEVAKFLKTLGVALKQIAAVMIALRH